MRVIDPGHKYALAHLDGKGETILVFVKREGAGYPGNVGAHEGTNIQEVLRAQIDRLKYLDAQIPHWRNKHALQYLREALLCLECRAAERTHRPFVFVSNRHIIETLPTCRKCGHIGCQGRCHP